jgi:outer membrane protein OmpA-like peptidoglycan-associated protein
MTNSTPPWRSALELLMLTVFVAACGQSSKAPIDHPPAGDAKQLRTASGDTAQQTPAAPMLDLKEYPANAAAHNRAAMLSVRAFRADEKQGDQYAKAGTLWLIVDAQWARQSDWSPQAGTSSSLHLGESFFLLVNGEQRSQPLYQNGDSVASSNDTAPIRLSTEELELPPANAPPKAGLYVFAIPDHGVTSLELVSFDPAWGEIRVPLFGARPTEAAPVVPPAHAGHVELGVLGVREVDMLGDLYPGDDSHYLVVDLRLRNLSTSSVTKLDPNAGWQVSDSIGDRYPVYVIESLSGRFLSPTALLPSMAQRGIVVFEVPYHHYALTMTALADDGSPLRVVLPATGPDPAPAPAPLSKFEDGDSMTVSILSIGRTGTLAPILGPPDSVIDTAGGGRHANRYLILETQFESSGSTDTQIREGQFTLVHGSAETNALSHELNALPSQLGHSSQGVVPAHGTRRYYFVFTSAPDTWDDLVVRYHGTKGDRDFRVAKPAALAAPAPDAAPPVNVADSDTGGEIETISGTYGSGYTGRDLLRATKADPWTPENGAQFPFDIALSFYLRSSALISGVELILPNEPRAAPREVEVWSSTVSATTSFTKLASAALDQTQQVQRISFPPVEARFVKIRILSGTGGPFALELAGIRVLEAAGGGYVPLSRRFPQSADWTLSPRRAAQLGIDWLQASTIRWQLLNRCFGCHVQGQTAMGLAVAGRNEYVVSDPLIDRLAAYTASRQLPNGPDRGALPVPMVPATILPTVFAAMSYGYLDRGRSAAADAGLASAALWLLSKQAASGEVVPENTKSPPIDQGSIMASANAAFGWSAAFAQTHDPKYQAAVGRALNFIASAPIATTQDEVFKILALENLGSDQQKADAAKLAAQLAAEEYPDGGWREAPDLDGPNTFATGQALYALKQAGVSVDSDPFRRGVEYLLRRQEAVGDWMPGTTHSPSQVPYAPTMWAVIGLAGSFNAHKADGEPPPTLERKFKVEVDSTGRFVLHINFDFDKATLRPDALPVIDQVAALLQHRPDWQFDINGYTDNVGTDQHNQRLSEQRAQAVLKALVERQVDARRMASAGFGKSGPVATNDTEEGRFQNRRVEFVKR